MQYVFDNVVSFVVNKTKVGGIYLMSDTKTGTKTTSSMESFAQHGGRKQAYTINCHNNCIFDLNNCTGSNIQQSTARWCQRGSSALPEITTTINKPYTRYTGQDPVPVEITHGMTMYRDD